MANEDSAYFKQILLSRRAETFDLSLGLEAGWRALQERDAELEEEAQKMNLTSLYDQTSTPVFSPPYTWQSWIGGRSMRSTGLSSKLRRGYSDAASDVEKPYPAKDLRPCRKPLFALPACVDPKEKKADQRFRKKFYHATPPLPDMKIWMMRTWWSSSWRTFEMMAASICRSWI